jgi:MFS family permease
VSFQVALVVAVAVGLLGVAVYAFQVDPPTRSSASAGANSGPSRWRDVGFRRYMRFTVLLELRGDALGSVRDPVLPDALGMTFTQVAFVSSITALTALVTTPLWGRVADRIGHRPVLALGTVLVGLLLPGGWVWPA